MKRLTLTPAEAAEALGIGKTTLFDWIRWNWIPSFKVNNIRRIPLHLLEERISEWAKFGGPEEWSRRIKEEEVN